MSIGTPEGMAGIETAHEVVATFCVSCGETIAVDNAGWLHVDTGDEWCWRVTKAAPREAVDPLIYNEHGEVVL